RVESDLGAMKDRLGNPESIQVSPFQVEKEMRDDRWVDRQRERLVKLEEEIIAYRKVATMNSTRLQQMETEVTSILDALKRHRETLRDALRGQAIEDLRNAITEKDRLVQTIKKNQEDVNRNITRLEGEQLQMRHG